MKNLIFIIAVTLSSFSYADDNSAMSELKRNSWVKDLMVSPGVMNIGVISTEKNWGSPMIAKFSCAVLRNNHSDLNYVRFVDIEQVVYKKKSPSSAEIAKYDCRVFK